MERGENGFAIAPSVTKIELTWPPRLQGSVYLTIMIFVLYWLSNHDKAATDVGGVGGKSASSQESDILVPWYV
jgi:hypothetical protein